MPGTRALNGARAPCAALTELLRAGALAARYLQHADVRFYTYVAARRRARVWRTYARAYPAHVAAPLTRVRRVRARARLCDRGCASPSDGGGAGGGASVEDVTRNVFDVLRSTPPHFAAVDGADEAGTWCGWEQHAADAAAAAAAASRKRARAAAAPPAAALSTPRWADAASQRRAFSDAWLSLLRMELPLDVYKVRLAVRACVCAGAWHATSADALSRARAFGGLQKVLAQMHASVVPHLMNPLLLSDFLTRAINLGAMLGMLALNGMFLLMTQHGLEYAQFYVRLYGACGLECTPARVCFYSRMRVLVRADTPLGAPPRGALQACWSPESSTRGTAASFLSCWTCSCAPRSCRRTWWRRLPSAWRALR
jgi:U3 small nucleolar RNA-associated protein 19